MNLHVLPEPPQNVETVEVKVTMTWAEYQFVIGACLERGERFNEMARAALVEAAQR